MLGTQTVAIALSSVSCTRVFNMSLPERVHMIRLCRHAQGGWIRMKCVFDGIRSTHNRMRRLASEQREIEAIAMQQAAAGHCRG